MGRELVGFQKGAFFGERYDKFAAGIGFTDYTYFSAVHFNEFFGQTQSDPGSRVGFRGCIINLMEPIKDLMYLLFSDPVTGILDRQNTPSTVRAVENPYIDPATSGCEFQSIGHQV